MLLFTAHAFSFPSEGFAGHVKIYKKSLKNRKAETKRKKDFEKREKDFKKQEQRREKDRRDANNERQKRNDQRTRNFENAVRNRIERRRSRKYAERSLERERVMPSVRGSRFQKSLKWSLSARKLVKHLRASPPSRKLRLIGSATIKLTGIKLRDLHGDKALFLMKDGRLLTARKQDGHYYSGRQGQGYLTDARAKTSGLTADNVTWSVKRARGDLATDGRLPVVTVNWTSPY